MIMNNGDKSIDKWAIMLCIDPEEDDWIFVTEDNGRCDMWDLRPVLFDEVHEALAYSEQWVIPGKEENVLVVNYDEEIGKR